MDVVKAGERIFINSMINGIENFYCGLSLSDDENLIDEPKDISYKRVPIDFKEFAISEKFDWITFSKKPVYSNIFSIFFPESISNWGFIKRIFILDSKGTVWFSQKLARQRNVKKFTTVIFSHGEITIGFE